MLAGLAAGVLDLGSVIVYYGLNGVRPTRILHGIAAILVGREAATNGGIATAWLGMAVHFAIAFCVAGMFYAVSCRIRALLDWPAASDLHTVLSSGW